MYKNNFVVALKSNGKILREEKENVYVKFNNEYSILFKNLDSVNNIVITHVYIDGIDVLNGQYLLILPNDSNELLSSYINNRKFKFIEKTNKITNYRENKIEDSIIKVEWIIIEQQKYIPYYPITPIIVNPTSIPIKYPEITWNSSPTTACYDSNTISSNKIMVNNGITVGGTESKLSTDNISSQTYSDFYNYKTNFICLKLNGYKNNKIIKKTINTKDKKICKICGTVNKQINKYCRECGSFLE